MAEKEVMMKLKVDLHCQKCMKRVRKALSKFPTEIREQTFDEKQNLVIIKVVCLDPEKIRDKICCKSEGSIKTIEISPIPKPPDPKPTTDGSEKEKKKETEAVKQPETSSTEKPKKVKGKPVMFVGHLFEEPEKQPCPPPQKPCQPPPAIGYPPQLMPALIGRCYQPWCESRRGGPCLCFGDCYGRPFACYCGCHHGRPSACDCGCRHGGPVYDCYGGGRACNVSTCEQSASGCTTM